LLNIGLIEPPASTSITPPPQGRLLHYIVKFGCVTADLHDAAPHDDPIYAKAARIGRSGEVLAGIVIEINQLLVTV
jgi:hypothetical protein